MIRYAALAAVLALAAPTLAAEPAGLPAIRSSALEALRGRMEADWDLRTRGEARADRAAAPDPAAVRREIATLRTARADTDSVSARALLYLEYEIASEAISNAPAAARDSLAKSLGYADYTAFAAGLRGLDPASFLERAFAFIRETNLMYKTLLAEQAHEILGKDAGVLTAADLARLVGEDPADAAFPKELLVPSLRAFLSGMGLDLRTASGTDIRIDATDRPAKNGRAACLPVDVPGDVRISVKPSGGLGDYRDLFHEAGHAVHFANAPAEPWELSRLGPAAVTEGVSALFAGAWSDPGWLRSWRTLAAGEKGGGGVPARLDDVTIARLERRGILRDLYFFRRSTGQVLFEAIRHDADPEITRLYVFEADRLSPAELYRQLMGFAAGIDLPAADAGDCDADVEPFFRAADYVRGIGLAAILDDGFRARFGEDWFAKADTGTWLRTELFAAGNRLSPEEVAARLGADGGFSFMPLKARLARQFKDTEAVIEAARR